MPRGACVLRYRGKRGDVWRVKYRDAEGTQVQETLGPESEGWNRKKAEAELRERLVRVERKDYRRPRPLTFKDYAESWYEEGKRKRHWKPRTEIAYRNVLDRIYPSFATFRLGAIRPRDVAAHVREALQTYSAKTVNLDLSILHDVFKTAKREELIDSNPVEGVERPKIKVKRWRILEPAEVSRVLRGFKDEQARTMFLTLVLTGVRRFELQALRWRDVDLVECVLRVRDSKSEEGVRSIALSPTLAEALWQHRRRSGYQGDDERVFCHAERGSTIGHEWFAEQFRAALKEAGISDYIRPFHDLRHTAITNDAAAGSSPIAVMSKAGHRSMATTQTYLHLAGVVFADEANALERRMLGGSQERLYPPEPISPDLTAPDSASQEALRVR